MAENGKINFKKIKILDFKLHHYIRDDEEVAEEVGEPVEEPCYC